MLCCNLATEHFVIICLKKTDPRRSLFQCCLDPYTQHAKLNVTVGNGLCAVPYAPSFRTSSATPNAFPYGEGGRASLGRKRFALLQCKSALPSGNDHDFSSETALHFLLFLPIDFRLVRAAKNVVDAHIVELCQPKKGFRRRDSVTVFKFRQQRLLDPGLHLQRDLCISSTFS